MSTLPPRPSQGLCLEARRKLSAPVINIEMTLISVLLGVCMFPLMESATPLVRTLRFEYWPYIGASLLFIMWVWTSVIIHALTFVGWPLFFLADSIFSFNPLRELLYLNAAAELCNEEEDILLVRDRIEQDAGVHESRL